MVQEKDTHEKGILTLGAVLLASLIAPLAPSAARAGGQPVAIIEVTGNPNEQYTLERGGQQVLPLQHRMEILADDVVTPKAGRQIGLQYLSTGCGRKEISQKTVVAACQSPAKGAKGGASSSFSRLFNEIFKKTAGDASHTYTTRGLPGPEPPLDLPVAWWPPAGSTMLAGERILFRFLDPDHLVRNSGQTASLVIGLPAGGATLLEIPIAPGEFEAIPSAKSNVVLLPGQSYAWRVTLDGKDVVPAQSFRILTQEESERIKGELRKVAEDYPASPLLAQALYLQTMSDEEPSGLKLYADSLRLILAHGHLREVPPALINRLQQAPAGDRR